MIRDIASFKNRMDSFLAQKGDRWKYGNGILYRMCREEPKHDDPDIAAAKVWLIGRSYAAAIERRKNADGFSGDFYHDVVAPKMTSISDELDSRLERINAVKRPDENAADLILSTHHLLMKAFYEITGLEKRSLAAKYLHFHCPAAFYIYDSIASQEAKKIVSLDRGEMEKFRAEDVDPEYRDFFLRCLEIKAATRELYGRELTPREIDSFLLRNTQEEDRRTAV